MARFCNLRTSDGMVAFNCDAVITVAPNPTSGGTYLRTRRGWTFSILEPFDQVLAKLNAAPQTPRNDQPARGVPTPPEKRIPGGAYVDDDGTYMPPSGSVLYGQNDT